MMGDMSDRGSIPITEEIVTRHDGQRVRLWTDDSQTDPDMRYRFEMFPAACGCYPPNTDDRAYVCAHGARWTRRFMEPYGMPD